MSNLDDAIGARIRFARNTQGISQDELARRVTEITGETFRQQTILRTEQGDRPLRWWEAFSIARALGVPLTDLIPNPGETVETTEALAGIGGHLQGVAASIAVYNKAAEVLGLPALKVTTTEGNNE